MAEPMQAGAARGLTDEERASLSDGLAAALDASGVSFQLVAAVHPAARIAGIWRGGAPILARGHGVWWPGALADFSAAGDRTMATLQHELQHVLDYATGALTAAGYLTNPHNWTYRYRLDGQSAWSDLGAEQRASIAEHYWLMQRGRADLVERLIGREPPRRAEYRRIIPWA